MKKVFISCAVLFASTLSMQSFAQDANKESGIHYTIDVPSTAVPAQDKKIQALDKQFKAFETAMNTNDKATAVKLKTAIVKWNTDNQSWINGLDRHLKDAVNGWYESAFSTLKLYEEIK